MFRKTGHILVRSGVSQTLQIISLLVKYLPAGVDTFNQYLFLSQGNTVLVATPFVRIWPNTLYSGNDELNHLSGKLHKQARVSLNAGQYPKSQYSRTLLLICCTLQSEGCQEAVTTCSSCFHQENNQNLNIFYNCKESIRTTSNQIFNRTF